MSIGLTEMRRRPARFLRVGAALAVLVLLLLSLGGLTDGLTLKANAALRAIDGDLVVFGKDARLSFLRSRVDAATADAVAATDGVDGVEPFGVSLLGSTGEGGSETIPAAVLGFEGTVEGIDEPPGAGEAVVDTAYRDDHGVKVGDSVALGPMALPVTVTGFVADTPFLYQSPVWVDIATWEEVVAGFRPDATFGPGESQVLVVSAGPDVAPEELAARIDESTGGATETVTVEEAGMALPGVSQQASTFRSIIGVTFLVVGIVVAMFFVLLTIEHLSLFGVMKAVGASNRQVVSGVVAQALVVAVASFVVGVGLTLVVAALIGGAAPLSLQPSRFVQVAVGVILVSVLGSLVSLRRVVRVDPVTVIG